MLRYLSYYWDKVFISILKFHGKAGGIVNQWWLELQRRGKRGKKKN